MNRDNVTTVVTPINFIKRSNFTLTVGVNCLDFLWPFIYKAGIREGLELSHEIINATGYRIYIYISIALNA